MLRKVYLTSLILFSLFHLTYAQTEIGITAGASHNYVRFTTPIPASCLSISNPITVNYGFLVQHPLSERFDARLTFRRVSLKSAKNSTCSQTNFSYGRSTFFPFRMELTPIFHLGKKQKTHFIMGAGMIYEYMWELSSNTAHGVYEHEDNYYEIQETNHHLKTYNFLLQGLVGLEIPQKKYTLNIELLYQQGFIDTYRYDYYLRFNKQYDEDLKTSKLWNGSNFILQITLRRPWRMKPKKIS